MIVKIGVAGIKTSSPDLGYSNLPSISFDHNANTISLIVLWIIFTPTCHGRSLKTPKL